MAPADRVILDSDVLVARARRLLARIGGCQVLRMTQNPVTQTLYERVAHALAA